MCDQTTKAKQNNQIERNDEKKHTENHTYLMETKRMREAEEITHRRQQRRQHEPYNSYYLNICHLYGIGSV